MPCFYSKPENAFTRDQLPHLSNEEIEKLDHEVEDAGAPVNNQRWNEMLSAERRILNLLHTLIDRNGTKELKTYVIGSAAANLNIGDSDIDLSVSAPCLMDTAVKRLLKKHKGAYPAITRSQLLFQCLLSVKYIILAHQNRLQSSKGKKKDLVYTEINVIPSTIPVLKMFDSVSKVEIDIVYDGLKAVRNSQFLVWNTQLSSRFSTLCRAIKYWAEQNEVQDSKHGKLNSYSVCLMMIHFLQAGVYPAVLPCLHTTFPELLEELEEPRVNYHLLNYEQFLQERWYSRNNMSVGVLFHLFFEYYRNFDFENNYISVRAGEVVKREKDQVFASNRKDDERHLIVVEDPFISPNHNCAGTVRKEESFRHIIDRIWNMSEWIRRNGTIYTIECSFPAVDCSKNGKQRVERDSFACNKRGNSFSKHRRS